MRTMQKTSAQIVNSPLTKSELEFINTVAIPALNKTQDEKSLHDLSNNFWNLCQWEKGRADILDSKASYMFGISSIAAAIVTFGAVVVAKFLVVAAVCLAAVAITLIMALIALTGKSYGSFIDKDIFDSLGAHSKAVGPIDAFTEKDPYRCYLRETILQRWLIYRSYCNNNDEKYTQLVRAQIIAVIAVFILCFYLVMILITR